MVKLDIADKTESQKKLNLRATYRIENRCPVIASYSCVTDVEREHWSLMAFPLEKHSSLSVRRLLFIFLALVAVRVYYT